MQTNIGQEKEGISGTYVLGFIVTEIKVIVGTRRRTIQQGGARCCGKNQQVRVSQRDHDNSDILVVELIWIELFFLSYVR